MLDRTPVTGQSSPIGGLLKSIDSPGTEENAPARNHSLFLDTSSKVSFDAWDSLLRLQVEFFATSELDFLGTFAPWQRAISVLDVGCGNGLYTSALHSRFPQKSYTGIDLSEELTNEARRCNPAIVFEVADFFDFTPAARFDLITMRFLVQHLTDLAAVLERCARLLRPGGHVLIIEPDVERSRNVPDTPLFKSLLTAFERSRHDNGLMRTRIARPNELLAGIDGWQLAADQPVSIRHAGTSARRVAQRLYLTWIDMFERSGLVRYPFDEVRQELVDWASGSCLTEIVLRAVCLRFAG